MDFEQPMNQPKQTKRKAGKRSRSNRAIEAGARAATNDEVGAPIICGIACVFSTYNNNRFPYEKTALDLRPSRASAFRCRPNACRCPDTRRSTGQSRCLRTHSQERYGRLSQTARI